MAFVLTITGLIMVVTGARNTYAQFGAQVAGDFTGPGNFTYWLASIGAVGALGYIKSFQEFSRYFMALIVIAMVLANKGLFAQLTSFLQNGAKAPQAPAETSTLPTIGQGIPQATPGDTTGAGIVPSL